MSPLVKLVVYLSEIIESITEIPTQERPAVLAYALSLFRLANSQEVFLYHQAARQIIGAAARVPAQEREIFFPILSKFIFHGQLIDFRNQVEKAVNITAPDKEGIFRNALMATYPDLDCTWLVIQGLATLPINERELVATLTHRVRDNGGPVGDFWILKAVKAIPADDRNEVVHYALQLITPGMHAHDKIMILEQVARQPANLRADYVRDRLEGIHHPEPAEGINIHEGDRDDRVKAAVQLLYQSQGDIPQVTINQAADAFIAYLNDSPVNDTDQQLARDKQLAREALLTPIRDDEQFGPLIEQENFILSGLVVSGRELIGRLWIFASQLDETDQTNVKRSMISALKDSYDTWGRVCNVGKTQRLVLAVLQGRLEGVNIEETIIQSQVSKEQAMRMFFELEAHRLINTKTSLIQAANKFCDENPKVNRQEFLGDVNVYAAEQEMAEK